MAEPDELYTLRAQYWLGHYNLCLEEAKSIARRPMSAALKTEREEFILRALLAMGQHDKVAKDGSGPEKSPGLQALSFRALYETSGDDEAAKEAALDKIKTLLGENPGDEGTNTLRITAAHVFLQAGMTKDALALVFQGGSMEQQALALQIYIKMDRLDLAADQLSTMRSTDEDSVLTQLCSVYLDTANGRSTAPDAVHHLSSLTEQYGPSIMLLNCVAVANVTAGDLEKAEAALVEAAQENPDNVDTLINTVVCYQHMGKGIADIEPLLLKLKAGHSSHPFVQGLMRVEGAFEREAVKYKVPTKA